MPTGCVQRPIRRELYPAPTSPRRSHAAQRPASSGSESEYSHATIDSNHSSEVDDTPPGLLSQVVDFINANKLANIKPAAAASAYNNKNGLPPAALKTGDLSADQAIKWVQPSGPRKPGEGIENEEQGILTAEQTKTGGVLLRITLLAAGFVIGPSGTSVRDVTRHTGADIKSWTEVAVGKYGKRPVRLFTVEGPTKSVIAALHVITSAVDRYKELCEGRCNGLQVSRVQRIAGVEFCYQPPPRNVVPFAAALKGQAPTRAKSLPDPVLMARQVPVPSAAPTTTMNPPAMDPLSAMLAAAQMAGMQMPAQQAQQPHTQRPTAMDPRYAAQMLATIFNNPAMAQAVAAALPQMTAASSSVAQQATQQQQPAAAAAAAMMPQAPPGVDQTAYIQQLQQVNSYLLAAIATSQGSTGNATAAINGTAKPATASDYSQGLPSAALGQPELNAAHGAPMQSAFAQATGYNPFQDSSYQQASAAMWPYNMPDMSQYDTATYMAAAAMARQGSHGLQGDLGDMMYSAAGGSDVQTGRDQDVGDATAAMFRHGMAHAGPTHLPMPLGVPGSCFESPRRARGLGAISASDPIVKSPITAKAKSLLKQRRKMPPVDEGGEIDFGALSSMFGAAALGSTGDDLSSH